MNNDALFSNSWQYKGNLTKSLKQARICKIVDTLYELGIPQKAGITLDVQEEIKQSDDYLDAFVCYVISALFVSGSDVVALYGDAKRGSFLLPYDAKIYEQFENFISHK